MDVSKRFHLVQADESHIQKLIEYKSDTVMPYVVRRNMLSIVERFIRENVPKNIDKYEIIVVDEKPIGCVSLVENPDGLFLDEFYIEKNYRNMGIGSEIMNGILNRGMDVSLWVYKSNEKAIRLYEKFGFKVKFMDDERLEMEYSGGRDE